MLGPSGCINGNISILYCWLILLGSSDDQLLKFIYTGRKTDYITICSNLCISFGCATPEDDRNTILSQVLPYSKCVQVLEPVRMIYNGVQTNLNKSNTAGSDGISAKILKECAY